MAVLHKVRSLAVNGLVGQTSSREPLSTCSHVQLVGLVGVGGSPPVLQAAVVAQLAGSPFHHSWAAIWVGRWWPLVAAGFKRRRVCGGVC